MTEGSTRPNTASFGHERAIVSRPQTSLERLGVPSEVSVIGNGRRHQWSEASVASRPGTGISLQPDFYENDDVILAPFLARPMTRPMTAQANVRWFSQPPVSRLTNRSKSATARGPFEVSTKHNTTVVKYERQNISRPPTGLERFLGGLPSDVSMVGNCRKHRWSEASVGSRPGTGSSLQQSAYMETPDFYENDDVLLDPFLDRPMTAQANLRPLVSRLSSRLKSATAKVRPITQ